MKLRSATEQDLARIIPWIASAEDCLLWAGPRVVFPMTVASLRDQIHFAGDNTFVLTTGGELLAFGQLLQRDIAVMHLARILVNPARRGGGNGRRLCEGLIDVAAGRGADGVSLFVYRSNAGARRLYAGLGFVEIPERSSDTVIFMLKPLARPRVPAQAATVERR